MRNRERGGGKKGKAADERLFEREERERERVRGDWKREKEINK